MNSFESGQRKIIPAVLIYVRSADDRILMIHRAGGEGGQGKPGDYHAGKWNGLGGKLEADESPWQGARRELLEEAGIELGEKDFRLLGTLQFPLFKAHKNEDWMVFVLSVRLGSVAADVRLGVCAEGTLHWVSLSDVMSLNLWPGDREFIPHVLAERPFAGTIWYQGQVVSRARVEAL